MSWSAASPVEGRFGDFYSTETYNFVDLEEDELPEDLFEDLASFDIGDAVLAQVFALSGLPGVEFRTPFEYCLRPFLDALGSTGDPRHVVEAIPHQEPIENLDTMRAVISRLGFTTKVHRISLRDITQDRLPALVMLEPDRPAVLLSKTSDDRFLVFDGKLRDFSEVETDKQPRLFCFAEAAHAAQNASADRKRSWISDTLYFVRKPLALVCVLTFIANFLGLATPIYVMNVYNTVIPTNGIDTLAFFVLGLGIVMALEIVLKRRRGRLIAFVGARVSAGLMNAGFMRLLNLPISMIESAPISSQILRLRQFERLHGFFTGAIATALLDLPFVILFFIAIAFISPILAVIPIVLSIAFGAIAILSLPATQRRVSDLNTATASSQDFLTDAVTKRVSIQQLCVEDEWCRRYTGLSRDLSARRLRVQFSDAALGVIAQMLVMTSGIATLMVGATLVMDEVLSVGGLIAVMMFIWRVLSPVQTVFMNLNRLSQFAESLKQFQGLMRIPIEFPAGLNGSIIRKFEGRISFGGVAFRYGPQDEPVFRGLNLDIQAGQMVSIVSSNASGKSTVLKLILGLYKPQAGSVFLDGLNLQQINPKEVRASIAYVPIKPVFFYGTIAQNMRLACPTASDADLKRALEEAGVDLSDPMFPEGLETRLTNHKLSVMPNGTLQCLSLARAYCKEAKIYLFNDPSSHLDKNGDRALARKLASLKGKATIVLVTNRANHLSLCDRILTLQNGVLADDRAPTPDDAGLAV